MIESKSGAGGSLERLRRSFRTAVVMAIAATVPSCALLSTDYLPIGALVSVGDRSDPVRLFVQESGEGSPLLLIHGFGTSTNTWRKILPHLARRHRVIALDLKGFGQSDKPLDRRYSAFDQANLLIDFIKRRNLHDLTIVGHSFGGAVALALTLELNDTEPNRVQRLVLIDSPAYRQDLPILFRYLRTPLVADLGVLVTPPEVQAKTALMAAYAEQSPIERQDVLAYARPLYEPGGRHALLQTAAQILPAELAMLEARYETIRQSTLLIWCRSDDFVPLWVGQRLNNDLPNSRLKVVDGCGHAPQEERPNRTLKIIKKFLGG